MELSEMQRLMQVEDENRRLKQIVAEQTLNIQALKAVVAKKRARNFRGWRNGYRGWSRDDAGRHGRRWRFGSSTRFGNSDPAVGTSMSAIVDLVLGVITSIGGFVEVGSISTSAHAGSEFGFQLLWAILVPWLDRNVFASSLASIQGFEPREEPCQTPPFRPSLFTHSFRLALIRDTRFSAIVKSRDDIERHAGAQLFIDEPALFAGGATLGDQESGRFMAHRSRTASRQRGAGRHSTDDIANSLPCHGSEKKTI